jgi:hypothetical protein
MSDNRFTFIFKHIKAHVFVTQYGDGVAAAGMLRRLRRGCYCYKLS